MSRLIWLGFFPCMLSVTDNFEICAKFVMLTLFTLTMLNLDISCFENSADPDQLASDRSQLIRIHTVFHSTCIYMQIAGILRVDWVKAWGRIVERDHIQHDNG